MNAVSMLLSRYGRAVTVEKNGAVEAGRAFVRPLREKQEQSVPTPVGRTRQDRFLYLGEAALSLAGMGEKDAVVCGGERYRVETAQEIYVGEEISHWWAILEIADEEETA